MVDVLLIVFLLVSLQVTGFKTFRLQVKHDDTIFRAREHPLDIQ